MKYVLSLIIPVAPNRGERLKAVLSRLTLSNQYYMSKTGRKLPWELIIVDGGATDDTYEIVRTFMQYIDIKYIYLPIGEFINPCYPRNVAIRVAEGSVLGHIDVDHWPSENILEGMVEPFWNHKKEELKKDTYIINRGYAIDSTESQYFRFGGYSWAEKFNNFMLDQNNLNATIESVYREAKIPPPGVNNTLWTWSALRKYVIKMNGYDERYIKECCREDDSFREKMLAQGLKFYDMQHKSFCVVHLWHSAPYRSQNKRNKKLFKDTCCPVKDFVSNRDRDWGKMLSGSFSIIYRENRAPQQHEEWIRDNIHDISYYKDSWNSVLELKNI